MKFLTAIILLLASTHTQADIKGSPCIPEVDSRFDAIGAQKTLRLTWNPSSVSTDGDSTTDSGVHSLNGMLPANAIIKRSYGYVVTAPTSSAQFAKVGFECEDTNNILDQTNMLLWNAGSLFNGKQFGGASTPGSSTVAGMTGSIASACTVKARVSQGAFSAGKINLFIEYVIGQ